MRYIIAIGLILATMIAACAQVPSGTVPLPPPATVPVDPELQIVNDFVNARSKHDVNAAYPLVCFVGGMSLKDYKNANAGMKSVEKSIPPEARKLLAVIDFLFDVDNTKGYQYEIVGRAKLNVINIRVTPGPDVKDATPYEIGVVVGVDPVDHHEKILAVPSMFQADPKAMMAARDRARVVSCLSNVRQINLAVLEYLQDHDEIFPDANKWMDELMPYIGKGHKELFHCPADTNQYSYSFNRSLSHQSLAIIDNPAKTVMIFESTSGKYNQSDIGSTRLKKSRHSGVINYGMADGHGLSKPDTEIVKIQDFNHRGR